MLEQYKQNIAAGERDKHVMIVFTDGKDNISTLDNTDNMTGTCPGFCKTAKPICQDGNLVPNCPNQVDNICHTPTQDAPFTSEGYPCVDREAVATQFALHPNLQVHVIGLGENIDEGELQYMATAGHGIYKQGANADDIPNLFKEVVKEFATVNSQGADIPQPIGEYKFSISISEKATPKSKVKCSFQYNNAADSIGAMTKDIGTCTLWPVVP